MPPIMPTREHADLLPTAKPRPLTVLAEALNNWFASHRRGYLGAACVLCLLTFSGYAHAKVPWMDEVVLLTIARLKGLHEIWAALMAGVQIDPPVLQILVHYLYRFFGEHILLARLPAIVGFTLMCASLAILLWRHVPPIYAAAAFFLPYATVLRVWSMDARPYGMMMGFSALALLCWDRFGDPQLPHRTAWRIAFVLSLAATFSTHFYSILLLGPLALGELTRWIPRRKPDWWTVLCTVIALIPYVVWLPILRSSMRIFQVSAHHYRGAPSFENFSNFYSWAIPSLPMAGILLLTLAAFFVTGPGIVRPEPLSLEHRSLFAVALGFLALPFIGFAAAVTVTGFFINYYFMIAAFGVILGIPLMLAAASGNSRIVGLCVCLAIFAHGAMVTARGLSDYRRRDIGYPTLASMRALIPEPHPDIAVAAPALFLPAHEANKNDPEDNLLFLFDAQKSLDEDGTNSSDLLYRQIRPYTNARIEPFDSYVAAHPVYYLAVPVETTFDMWQYPYLVKRRHARLWWLGNAGVFDLYRVDIQAGH